MTSLKSLAEISTFKAIIIWICTNVNKVPHLPTRFLLPLSNAQLTLSRGRRNHYSRAFSAIGDAAIRDCFPTCVEKVFALAVPIEDEVTTLADTFIAALNDDETTRHLNADVVLRRKARLAPFSLLLGAGCLGDISQFINSFKPIIIAFLTDFGHRLIQKRVPTFTMKDQPLRRKRSLAVHWTEHPVKRRKIAHFDTKEQSDDDNDEENLVFNDIHLFPEQVPTSFKSRQKRIPASERALRPYRFKLFYLEPEQIIRDL